LGIGDSGFGKADAISAGAVLTGAVSAAVLPISNPESPIPATESRP
jgi:hypothetical protein